MLSEYLSCVRINCFRLYRGRAYAIHHVAIGEPFYFWVRQVFLFLFYFGIIVRHILTRFFNSPPTAYQKIHKILSTLEVFFKIDYPNMLGRRLMSWKA